jgi:hypothetical protein
MSVHRYFPRARAGFLLVVSVAAPFAMFIGRALALPQWNGDIIHLGSEQPFYL